MPALAMNVALLVGVSIVAIQHVASAHVSQYSPLTTRCADN